MRNHRLNILSVLLTVLISVTSGRCSAFPPKPLNHNNVGVSREPDARVEVREFPLPKRATGYFASSSSTSEFSPDTNAQRKSKESSRHHREAKLRSSIPVDFDANGRSNSPFTQAVDTAWNSVSRKFAVLASPSARHHGRRLRLLQQRKRLASQDGSRFPFRAVGTIDAPAASEGKTTTRTREKLTRFDLVLFVTYFCNIVVLTSSVVTVPAMAVEHNLSPHATAAFCASMASIAPLGGFLGKLVNGFVCQRLGGRRSSWLYLLTLACLSFGMSFVRSLASVGFFLFGIDFLSSIQWTSATSVLNEHYRQNPRLKTRGINILSIASTVGALSAKTIGAGLLQATQWRTVCRVCSVMALVGATTIYFGGSQKPTLGAGGVDPNALGAAARVSAGGEQPHSPLAALKSVLGNPIFWMIGAGHSLGHVARVSDRLLGPFLQEVGGISSSMAVSLTSSVTIGFVLGLFRGSVFNKVKSIKEKTNMIKKSYIVTVLSTFGLAACGTKSVSKLMFENSNMVMAAITLFSGIIASTVSFQFYQFPNLMSSTIFPDSSSVALSLTDALGFLLTAGVMGINSLVLGNFGWTASWAFIALVFSLGGLSMTRALPPILIEKTKRKRLLGR